MSECNLRELASSDRVFVNEAALVLYEPECATICMSPTQTHARLGRNRALILICFSASMQPPPAAATPATPKLSFAQTLAHGTPQAMLYLLVLDFEATCDENRGFGPQEVIEFPTVVINTCTLKKEAEFHSYVRPVRNRKLTPFCTSLTGITQEQVDPAPTFPEVWEKCVSTFTLRQCHTLDTISMRVGSSCALCILDRTFLIAHLS